MNIIMNDRNDFRKYAVRHLGMDGLTIDEVMKAQAVPQPLYP